jgi:hypothetical protein
LLRSIDWLAGGGALAMLSAGLIACGGESDLSTDQLSKVVAAQQPTLKRCYDAALETYPSKHELRLQAAIHIAASGRVSAVEIEESESTPPGLRACLLDAIAAWKFPEAGAATHTSLPLIFKPEVVPSGPSLDDVQKVLEDVRKKDLQAAPQPEPARPDAAPAPERPATPPPTPQQ